MEITNLKDIPARGTASTAAKGQGTRLFTPEQNRTVAGL